MDFPKAAGFDLETAGDRKEYPLQPWRAQRGEAYIKAASISVGEAKAGHLNPDPEIVRKMLLYAISQDMYMVGWNVAFDVAWCIAVGLEQEVFKVKWLDGMLLWRHAKVEPEGDVPSPKRKKFSLEGAMKKYYPDNADFKEFKDFAAEDEESLQKLLHRNKEDAAWTVTLTEKFWHMLDPEQQRAALIEARCIPMMAWCMVNGIYSDAEAAQVLADKLAGEAVDIYKELLASSPEVRGLNLNSTPQLQTLLYDTWGLTAERFSKKTGNPSTDKYALFDLAAIDKRAKLLKKLREAKNNRTKYAIGTLKSLDYNGDGYVRPSPKIFSTYTSRITYGSKDKGEVEVTKTTKKNGTQTYTKNAEMPSGVPLHQWKRGKEYRKLIKPPPGYLLAEFDFAGQEFRWMAVASEDPIMLSLCAPGEDPHSYMGAQVASREYRELVRMAKDGDTQAAVDRKCGKFCVAEGQLVLTDRGLVPIEKVLLADRVWDGVEWVNHEGLIYQGYQEVITYDGLTATPDHKVYLQNGGKCTIWEAASKGYRLACGGVGRDAVSFLDSDFAAGGEALSWRDIAACQMCLWGGEVHSGSEFGQRTFENVQEMHYSGEAQEGRACYYKRSGHEEGTEEMQCNEAALRESERPILRELWRAGNTFQIQQRIRCDSVCLKRAIAPNVSRSRYRPERERRPLRAWESSACDTHREFEKSQRNEIYRIQRGEDSFSSHLPRCPYFMARGDVLGGYSEELGRERETFLGADKGQIHEWQKLQTKRTYDLANAGPRHRFTVSGVISSNCNLSYQYRVSAKTATTKARVDFELDVDQQFIQETQNIYRQSYVGVGGPPGWKIGGYWLNQIQKCKQLGYAETFAGRRVQLKGSWAGDMKWPMESTSINYPIQGTGGDQKYLALAVARNHLPEFGGYFYYELHDGLFFIFPEDKALKAAEFFHPLLSNLPYEKAWNIKLPVDFPVDAQVGPSWGELKDLDKY